MFDCKEFGSVIRKLRKQKGYTILQLAMDLNIDDAYLGQIERGEKIPSIDVAVNIINYFNITFEDYSNFKNTDFNPIKQEIYNKSKLLSNNDYKFLYKALQKFILFERSEENV